MVIMLRTFGLMVQKYNTSLSLHEVTLLAEVEGSLLGITHFPVVYISSSKIEDDDDSDYPRLQAQPIVSIYILFFWLFG
jgi:hypothetical protein